MNYGQSRQGHSPESIFSAQCVCFYTRPHPTNCSVSSENISGSHLCILTQIHLCLKLSCVIEVILPGVPRCFIVWSLWGRTSFFLFLSVELFEWLCRLPKRHFMISMWILWFSFSPFMVISYRCLTNDMEVSCYLNKLNTKVPLPIKKIAPTFQHQEQYRSHNISS